MSVNLIQQSSKTSGLTHLSLDIHHEGKRRKQSLKLSYVTNAKSESEKSDRKSKLLLAHQIKAQKEKEILLGSYDLEEPYTLAEDFLQYADNYIARREGEVETRKFTAVVKKLKAFHKKNSLPCHQITESFLRMFVQSLECHLNGESASNYFKKLKQIIKAAVDDRHFKSDPSGRIKVRKTVYAEKHVLSQGELQLLWDTEISNKQIKRAFLLCCITGLRFCDVKALQWKHVQGKTLAVVQKKTKVAIRIPLNSDAQKLLGKPGEREALIFSLPSHTGCLKALRVWVERAGIEKHITFHCGRHSFGTNLILHEVDVATASKLLGHTSLTHTLRYVKISDQHKAGAVAKLPSILSNDLV